MANPEGKRKPKTAPNGAGTLIKIETPYGDRWRAVSTLHINEKTVRVSGEGRTPSEAYLRRSKNEQRRLVPKAERSREKSTQDYLREWLKELNPDLVSTTAKKQYTNHLELHVIPAVGTIKLRELDRADCRDLFHKTLRDKAYSETDQSKRLSGYALRSIYRTFKRALQWAMHEGYIDRNPLENVETPRVTRAKVKIEASTPKKLIRELYGDPDELRWLLAFFGLRQSEALGLTWDKIHLADENLKVGFISVEQQLARKETEHGCGNRTGKIWPCKKPSASNCPKRIGTPGWEIKQGAKTEAGNREIPLAPRLEELLMLMRINQRSHKKRDTWEPLEGLEELIFTTSQGKPRKHNPDTAAWHALLEKHGIPYQRGHISRHTTATLLASMTPPIPTNIVQNILGHSSEAMTAYYTHLNRETAQEPMQALENLLTGGRSLMGDIKGEA